MKLGTAIPLKHKYFEYVRAEVQRIFDELIYARLGQVIAEFTGVEIRNANSYLADAITTGKIWYDAGLFRGEFNSKTSKELRDLGATWNTASQTFSLSWEFVPPDLRMAQAHSEMRYDDLRRRMIRTLDDIHIDSIAAISDIPNKYKQTITWMNDDFVKAAKEIAIPPDLTEQQKNMIAADWGQNLDKYIRNWTSENITKLRGEIQTNAFGGRRSSAMVKYIQDNYEVSKRKAEFLARQETSLLMSKFHESRYADVGVYEYKWKTAHDGRVREDHKDLDGEIFRFDSPPVVDRRTGRRANPGEDYGCRCMAVPIVR